MTNDREFVRSNIHDLAAYTPGEQPKERGVVKLNTNENPYPPSLKVAEALKQIHADQLRLYPDPLGHALRDRIAKLHECDASMVFAGNGSDEILALSARAFVERDAHIGFFEPSYSLYPVLAAIEGVGTKPVRLPRNFSWVMPGDYAASLFFLANPNAPTSVLFPKKEVRDFCTRFAGVVVIDEAYVDFAKEDCMDLARTLDNVMVARTLSKSYSLAGLRLGYAVGPARLIAALYKIKDSYNVSFLAQQLGLAALSDVEHMRRNVRRINSTRDQIAAELRRRGFTVLPSETNFLWIKPGLQSAEETFEHLRERNILVRYFPGNLTGDYLRVTVGTDDQMERFLGALGK